MGDRQTLLRKTTLASILCVDEVIGGHPMNCLYRYVRGVAATLMVVLTVVLGAVPALFAQSTDPIVIGAVLSLTGRDAAF